MIAASDPRCNRLSTPMNEAYALASRKGKLERVPGGYWTWPGCERHSHNGVPYDYASTPTVEALVRRGYLEYVEWKEGRNGRFPITAALKHQRGET